ncbi:hypothetical protein E05_39960 [Plautia stali symbiont]|nr:hypothetical protein E05_39960 [Plautia stali symbiont]
MIIKTISREMINDLIDRVGGRENILSLSHCITRLRFVLQDVDKADPAAIRATPGVKGCFNAAGQFQVIIGTEVDAYYKALVEVLNISETSKEQIKSAARSQMKWHKALLSHFAEIFSRYYRR